MNLFVGRAGAGASTTSSAVMMTVGGWEKVNRFWVIRGKLSTLAYSSCLQLPWWCAAIVFMEHREWNPSRYCPTATIRATRVEASSSPSRRWMGFVFRVVVSPTLPLLNNDWDLLSRQPSMAYRSSAPKGVLLIRPLLNLCTGNGGDGEEERKKL